MSYIVRFKFDCAFIFGNVFEEYINEDKLIRLIPFMSIISKVQDSQYLTRVETGVGAGAAGSGAFVFSMASNAEASIFSTGSLSFMVSSSDVVFSCDSCSLAID